MVNTYTGYADVPNFGRVTFKVKASSSKEAKEVITKSQPKAKVVTKRKLVKKKKK